MAASERGEALAMVCSGCHSDVKAQGIPPIDYSAAELFEVMLAFKQDNRSSTVMGRLAKGYRDDELRLIAEQLGND